MSLKIEQAIILLPTSPSSTLPVTPQTLRDHIAFVSPPLSASSAESMRAGNEPYDDIEKESISVVVTLSGLVGSLRG